MTGPSATNQSGLVALTATQARLAKGGVALGAVAARAADAWAKRGLPHRGLEEWKYTGLGQIAESTFAVAPPPLPSENMKIATVDRGASLSAAAADLVFYNGHFAPGLSRLPSNPGVRVSTRATASASCAPAALAAGFGLDAERFARGPWFDAVNASLAQDFLLVEFLPGAREAAPIVITCISSSAPGGGPLTASAPRIFVRFAGGSDGAIVERCVTAGPAPALSMPSADVAVEAGGRGSYARVQAEGAESLHFGSLRAILARDAFFESSQISLGARISRQELTVRLEGEGAEATVDGLYVTQGRQHVDNRTSIEHAVGHTTSRQLYKGILSDDSRAVFNGRVRIEPQAQKSSAAQLCQNLALGKRAEIDAKPELEIFADDVKASHGATVGRMDPEQLFYFQARAIAPDQAARAVARGFAQDVAMRLRCDLARALASADVDAKLNSTIKRGLR